MLKYKKFFIIFWLCFLLPITIVCLISLPEYIFQNKNILEIEFTKMNSKEFFYNLIDTISPSIDKSTFSIIVTNIVVSLSLWLVVTMLLYICYRRKRDNETYSNKFIINMGIICFVFFFCKEGFRLVYHVVDFSNSMNFSYIFSMIGLILPHGIIEFTAFILAAVFSLNWLDKCLNDSKISVPKVSNLLIPICILLIAGVIETTLTPMVFENLILFNL